MTHGPNNAGTLAACIGLELLLAILPCGVLQAATQSDPPRFHDPLIAHWTFDSPSSAFASPQATSTRGIHGQALHLQNAHALKVHLDLTNAFLDQITFSAWVRPMELSSYREIFRQECNQRLLFSFQEHGAILSLGLNIGGYIECDAPLQPEKVLDGRWHHCAATFDGQCMRVFLDGREIGSLARPGRISIANNVPAFLGSGSGTSEHFQGDLDELRIYSAALSAAQINTLYQAGVEAVAAFAREMETALRDFYPSEKTFPETLLHLRKLSRDTNTRISSDLLQAAHTKLKSSFPKEHENFFASTGLRPLDYLRSTNPRLERELASRLMDLLLEYKPLTDQQWAKLMPEDTKRWQETDLIKGRFDKLVAQGETADWSPEWLEIMMAIGPRIQLRPVRHEAVAPYVKPETPSTRTLTAAEARQALQRDWLHQAGGNASPNRIKDEIRWTRELTCRLLAKSHLDLSAQLAELEAYEKKAALLSGPDNALYLQVRSVKRAIMLKNPALDFSRMLLLDMPFPQGSEWPHETRHRLGYMAVPGGRLLVLDGLSPHGQVRQLMPQAPLHGSFWRPDVSFDGQKILFCFKPHNEKSFHIYEINVDGSGLRQITDGPYDDLDPIYLPDGKHILFSTTRGHTYVRCMPPTSAFVLARCTTEGKNLFLISANNEPDYLPSVMNDGRVIYTRWEYTDKPLWRAQKLWTINPDGTQVLMFWGNQSVWPDLTKDARNIPNSRRVMFTGSAHHNWFAGSVGIIDPDRGFNFPSGLTKVTADVAWPECGNGPVDPIESPRYHPSGRYEAYYSPFPLTEQDFLVSANRGGKFVLYLMDVDGNRDLIYEGTHHVFHAIPLKTRPKPPIIEDRVTWPADAAAKNEDGIIFSSNVYEGAPAELKGKARHLRIFTIDHKTYTYWYKRPYISTGPVVSAVQSEGIKRLLGTVPVEPDGSVSFRAPAGLPLHFQLLDVKERALHTMRSFVNVMPGETRGCLGCHESHSRTPANPDRYLVFHKTPSAIIPPPWSDTTVSYPRYVQPVLNQYCGKCHQGDGEARKTFDMTERPSSPVFTEPYLTLIGRPSWGEPYRPPQKPPPGFGIAGCLMVEAYGQVDPAAYTTPKPMTALSYRSKLIEIASSGSHHDVKVDPISLQRLIVWVDAMCPYMGDEEIRQIPDPEFQGVDWLSVRPKIATAPRITRPGPL